MTANQIMFPLMAIAVVVAIILLRRHNKRPASVQKHAPHSPTGTGSDKGAIARSSQTGGHGGGF